MDISLHLHTHLHSLDLIRSMHRTLKADIDTVFSILNLIIKIVMPKMKFNVTLLRLTPSWLRLPCGEAQRIIMKEPPQSLGLSLRTLPISLTLSAEIQL